MKGIQLVSGVEMMGVMTAQPPLPLIPAGAIPIGDAAAMVADDDGGRVFIRGGAPPRSSPLFKTECETDVAPEGLSGPFRYGPGMGHLLGMPSRIWTDVAAGARVFSRPGVTVASDRGRRAADAACLISTTAHARV